MMSVPRMVIASPWSCSGKTTIAIGLMGALSKMGLRVQPFKIGPDFIDPSYHTAITGVRSRNLDTWLTSKRAVLGIFNEATYKADLAIIEGVMGLFDGIDGKSEAASTSEIAKILRAPVILVLDILNLARSAGALALGCKNFDKKIEIRGVILNRVTSERHARWAAEAIESKTHIPVLGAIPYDDSLVMPERHLGLIPTWERGELKNFFDNLIEKITSGVDLSRIMRIAKSAEKLPKTRLVLFKKSREKIKIGVAFDEAFNFYYWDNLDIFRAYGAEIKFFSPIHDKCLPEDITGIYIGGGFPEVLAKDISKNNIMKKSVKKAIEDEMPLYAECGGLMYLVKSVVDFDGRRNSMVGLFNGDAYMRRKLEALDYTLAKVLIDNPMSRKGQKLRGHEFHFSSIEGLPKDTKFAYLLMRGKGITDGRDGLKDHGCLASYMHLHFAQDFSLVENFIGACERYMKS